MTRILLAGLFAHYAAAYCFCAMTFLVGFLGDLGTEGSALFAGTSWNRAFEVIWTTPLVLAILALWGAILTSLSLVITLPVSVLAVRTLDVGPFSAMAIGFLPIPVLALGHSVFAGKPRIEEWGALGSAGASGAAFAWVVWMLCIRHRVR